MNDTMIATMIMTIIIFGLFVFALGFKMIFDKKAEFKGGCASNNPMLKNEIGECVVCGQVPEGECEVPPNDELPKIG